MADEKRKRAPALATRVDDVSPSQKNWSAPSTAETRCQNCDQPLPEGARFCPECSWDVSAIPSPKESTNVDEDSVVVDDATIGAKLVPTAKPTSVVPASPVAPEAPPASTKRRKGAKTLDGEAVQEGHRLSRFLVVLGLAALVIVIVWVASSYRSTPPSVPEPVSTTPISLLRYDAGAD